MKLSFIVSLSLILGSFTSSVLASNIIPKIDAKLVQVYSSKLCVPAAKGEKVKDANRCDYSQVFMAYTNVEWINNFFSQDVINTLLSYSDNRELTSQPYAVSLRQATKAFELDKKQAYQVALKERNTSTFGYNTLRYSSKFISQKGKLATFAISQYKRDYSALGYDFTQYLTFDLEKEQLLTYRNILSDVNKAEELENLLKREYLRLNGVLVTGSTSIAEIDQQLNLQNIRFNLQNATGFVFNNKGLTFTYLDSSNRNVDLINLTIPYNKLDGIIKEEYLNNYKQ